MEDMEIDTSDIDDAACLPEDDSIFLNLSLRSNISNMSDVLVEDPDFTSGTGLTSTPTRPAPSSRRVPAGRGLLPEGGTPPRGPGASGVAVSPRRSSRRAGSPVPSAVQRSAPVALAPGRAARAASPAAPLSAPVRRSSRCRSPAPPARAPAPAACSSSATTSTPSDATTAQKIKCPKCTQVLASKRNLDRHLRSQHLMKGIMAKAPSLTEYEKEMPELIMKTLDDIISEPAIGKLSREVKEFCVKLKGSPTLNYEELVSQLASSFHSIGSERHALFPSSVLSIFSVGVNRLLSGRDFRQDLKCNIASVCDNEDNVLNVLMGDLLLKLTDKVIVYTLQHIRGVTGAPSDQYRRRSKDNVNSIEFRQLSYFIGGSVVSGFLWKGVQYAKTSTIWNLFCDVILKNFVRDNETGENQCEVSIRSFTEDKDRGGLTHISDAAFSFFTSLFDFLMGLEGDTGAMPPNVVDEHVLKNDVLLCLWDALVGTELSEELSVDLLAQVSESCIKVVLKGIMKRRLNEHLKKAFDSVALRARLSGSA